MSSSLVERMIAAMERLEEAKAQPVMYVPRELVEAEGFVEWFREVDPDGCARAESDGRIVDGRAVGPFRQVTLENGVPQRVEDA